MRILLEKIDGDFAYFDFIDELEFSIAMNIIGIGQDEGLYDTEFGRTIFKARVSIDIEPGIYNVGDDFFLNSEFVSVEFEEDPVVKFETNQSISEKLGPLTNEPMHVFTGSGAYTSLCFSVYGITVNNCGNGNCVTIFNPFNPFECIDAFLDFGFGLRRNEVLRGHLVNSLKSQMHHSPILFMTHWDLDHYSLWRDLFLVAPIHHPSILFADEMSSKGLNANRFKSYLNKNGIPLIDIFSGENRYSARNLGQIQVLSHRGIQERNRRSMVFCINSRHKVGTLNGFVVSGDCYWPDHDASVQTFFPHGNYGLLIPHHGSGRNLTKKPGGASSFVISTDGISHGHPSANVLGLLVNNTVHRTDKQASYSVIV